MNIRVFAVLLATLGFVRAPAAPSILFNICAESTTWTRPTPEVQAKIWNMARYRGFNHDAYGTEDFIVVDDPLSASGAYDRMNLSGLWTEAPFHDKCDTDPNNRHNGDEWIEVWVLLHRVTQVTQENNTYTVTVEPTGKGFQFVDFRRMNPSVVLQFVAPDGRELERWESLPPRPARRVR